VTALDARAEETSHRWPRFLPDGKRFLFLSRKPKPPGRLALEVASVEGGERKRLLDSSTGGAVSQGRIFFVREARLLAQSFDTRSLTVSGDPVPVAEDVWRNPATDGLTAFAVAEEGTIASRRGGLVRIQLTWLDRAGRELGTAGPPAIVGDLDLSPDERRALVDVTDPVRDVAGLFELDVATGMTTRVSFGAANQSAGLYSPDGREIVFAWDLNGPFALHRLEIGGSGEPRALLAGPTWKFPESWSHDGRFLSYVQRDPGKTSDIWILPMAGKAEPFPFAQTPAEESGSRFSPDDRFLAYVSDESGRPEVFIRTFPASAAKWQASTGGGTSPSWRHDGKELFYLGPDHTLFAVPIGSSGRGPVAGAARPLFRNDELREGPSDGNTLYEASRDGKRFLASLVTGQAEASPIVIRTGPRP
jgi:Tol biopolymer transport system component